MGERQGGRWEEDCWFLNPSSVSGDKEIDLVTRCLQAAVGDILTGTPTTAINALGILLLTWASAGVARRKIKVSSLSEENCICSLVKDDTRSATAFPTLSILARLI